MLGCKPPPSLIHFISFYADLFILLNLYVTSVGVGAPPQGNSGSGTDSQTEIKTITQMGRQSEKVRKTSMRRKDKQKERARKRKKHVSTKRDLGEKGLTLIR